MLHKTGTRQFDELLNTIVGLDHFLAAFDERFNTTRNNSFPPHNIIKRSDTEFTVELAIAGFQRNDLTVTMEGDILMIEGNILREEPPIEYVFKGISTRNFTKRLKLVEGCEVVGATFKDGILSIEVSRKLPENKVKLIDIN